MTEITTPTVTVAYEVEFGPTLPDGEGGKRVAVYIDGVEVGELSQHIYRGERTEWSADLSIGEALGVDPYGFDDRSLRTAKTAIKRAAKGGAV